MTKGSPGSFTPIARWMVAVILTSLALLLASPSAQAVPAYPRSVEVTQPDGAKFKLRLHGDEYFSWEEDEEGYAVARDKVDQYWKYARPAKNNAAFEIIPEARVGKVDPRLLNLRKNALPDKAVLKEHVRAQRNLMKGRTASGAQVTTPRAAGKSAVEQPSSPPNRRPAISPYREPPRLKISSFLLASVTIGTAAAAPFYPVKAESTPPNTTIFSTCLTTPPMALWAR